MNTLPRLNVRTAAELLRRPIAKQLSKLRRMKYPNSGEGAFMCPYYSPVKTAMRHHFKGDATALTTARAKIAQVALATRRDNLERALASFEDSPFAQRSLLPLPLVRDEATFEGISLKLSPDLRSLEEGREHYYYVNFKAEQVGPATAWHMLGIAQLVLTMNGVEVTPGQLHLVDLFDGRFYNGTTPLERVMPLLTQECREIREVWPEL